MSHFKTSCYKNTLIIFAGSLEDGSVQTIIANKLINIRSDG